MRWKFKPVPTIKTVAATLSMWTMCIAPVAQGAEAARNKQLINQYLKESGLTTEKMTIGQFWGKVRHIYPASLQKQLDPWMAIHKNEMMPKIEASSFKDSDGKEQVRLLLTAGKESGTLTFTGDDDKPMKFNNVTMTRAELADYNKFDKLAEKVVNSDPNLKKNLVGGMTSSSSTTVVKKEKRLLKGREIAAKSLKEQMDYLLKMREASVAADKVIDIAYNKARKGAFLDYGTADSAVASLWNVLLGAKAVAKAGDSCIASGWVAAYDYDKADHNRYKCGAPVVGRTTILNQVQNLPFSDSVKSQVASCAQGGGLPCNPLLFGFKNNSGSPICITSNLNSATAQCDAAAPLPGNKQAIIQSIVAARGGDSSLCAIKGENTVSQACADKLEKYTDNLKEHYLNAAQFCTNKGVTDVSNRDAWVTKKGMLADQTEACEKLKSRFFDLQIEVAAPATPPVPCSAKVPGSHEGPDGKCVCADGKEPRPPQPKSAGAGKGHGKGPKATKGVEGQVPPPPGTGSDSGSGESQGQLTCEPSAPVQTGDGEVTDTPLPGGKEVAKDTCGFFCKYKGVLIAAGIGLVGLGLFWWLTKKKTKSSTPTYVPPAAPPLASPTTTPTATATIAPVPTNPCPSPNTMVNGVCTPPIFTPPDPPPVTTTTEGGTGTGPSGGGVR